MTKTVYITNKKEFTKTATDFFQTLFNPVFANNQFGEVEIRTFPKVGKSQQFFCYSINQAIEVAYNLCNQGIDVYFGVNPRIGRRGAKKNVFYVTAFHAEVDYGSAGHEKLSKYETYDQAVQTICNFQFAPTWINTSGGGLHCYWVIDEPIEVASVGTTILEDINRWLLSQLGGDTGTQNLDRVLRIPGTFNFKIPNNHREVRVFHRDGHIYPYNATYVIKGLIF